MKYYGTNCPNCGAVITGDKCEYCGTMFNLCEEPKVKSEQAFIADEIEASTFDKTSIYYDYRRFLPIVEAVRDEKGRLVRQIISPHFEK